MRALILLDVIESLKKLRRLVVRAKLPEHYSICSTTFSKVFTNVSPGDTSTRGCFVSSYDFLSSIIDRVEGSGVGLLVKIPSKVSLLPIRL